ncbi:MAG: tetratricopeptide repeat protein [Myxococcaceae bacterium]
MSDKLTRKELKQPDAFQAAGAQASSWFQERQKAIGVAVAVVIVGGLGIGLASYLSGRGEENASKDLGATLRKVDRPVEEKPTPGDQNETEELPPFKSQKEKDEATEQALVQFRKDHGDTRASTTAELKLAQAQFRLGKFDEALTGYEDYLKHVGTDEPLRASALEGKGYVFEAKKDYEKALAAFEELGRENKTPFLEGMGPYHRARVLIEMGKKDEAAKELSNIPTQFPQTAAARLAQERLSQLVASGVAPPVVAPTPVATDAG